MYLVGIGALTPYPQPVMDVLPSAEARDMEAAAHSLGLQLTVLEASGESEIDSELPTSVLLRADQVIE